ncbi:MAG TPA: hypothetical protein VMV69_07640 [Pirellulales bacterium]|nr:hypothetical protein [Pirellulales bacterium]
MIDDLRKVSGIPIAEIEEIAQRLECEAGFLADDRLSEIVATCVAGDGERSAATSALMNLRAEHLDQTLQTMQEWREAEPQNAESFSTETLDALRQRLRSLIRVYPAQERARKAARLRAAVGSTVEHVEILCDARPVFNKDRDRIEGLFPVVLLKLQYERQNEQTEVVELVLRPEILRDLLDKCEKARQKLNVLRESIVDWVPGGLGESS